MDHGSISFGRFAAESLEWEKWSVFSHNRCQEELEKFKAPGFVAQKKAYFEEYYKRIREIKASQAEKQEATGSDLNQDVKSHVTQVETGTNAALSKGEKKSSFIRQIQILDDDSSVNSDSSLESNVLKQEAVTKEVLSNNNEGASITYTTSESSCAFEPDRSMKGTCSFHTPVTRKTEIAQYESRVSNSVNLIANKPKTQVSSWFFFFLLISRVSSWFSFYLLISRISSFLPPTARLCTGVKLSIMTILLAIIFIHLLSR